MLAGTLDTKIVIWTREPVIAFFQIEQSLDDDNQSINSTQNDLGESVDTWIEFATLFARATPRPGKEFFQSKVYSDSYTFFTTRHTDGIKAHMRVISNGQTYEIVDVQYSEKRRESIQITARLVS